MITSASSLADQVHNERVVFHRAFELDYVSEDMRIQLGEHEVLVRTQYSLISPGTELALYTGTHVGLPDPGNTFAKYPFYPGYSIVGEVVATGAEVRGIAPGDKVYTIGKHAAYNVVPFNSDSLPLFKLPDDFIGERAVFARLAGICMTSIVQSSIRVGDTAVVMGLGLIGNLAAQLFSLLGANVIGVDVIGRRLDIAKLTEHVLQITGGAKADIVVEATGSSKLVVPALDLVRHLGQVIALGSTRGNVDLNVYEYIHRRGVKFIGAHEGLQTIDGFASRKALTHYILKLIGLGALQVDPLLTHKLPYTEAKHGYDMLLNQQDQALGVLLDWSQHG
jgi:2-desacetyl-2-hydroxyethyl bacteriochlorophyllide A dehydrogenase